MPLDVVTTLPDSIDPREIGLVVIFSPSENDEEPLMKPVMDLSVFCFQRLIDGTPFGACFVSGERDFGGFSAVLPSGCVPMSEDLSTPKNSESENVGRLWLETVGALDVLPRLACTLFSSRSFASFDNGSVVRCMPFVVSGLLC